MVRISVIGMKGRFFTKKIGKNEKNKNRRRKKNKSGNKERRKREVDFKGEEEGKETLNYEKKILKGKITANQKILKKKKSRNFLYLRITEKIYC